MALAQVKSRLGGDAVILHTRSFTQKRWLGLSRSPMVEITAGKRIPSYRPRLQAAPAAPKKVAPVELGLMNTAVASNALVMGLTRDVGELRGLVNDLVRETRAGKNPSVHPDLLEHYTNLIKNQVADDLASKIIEDLRSGVRADGLKNPRFVREKLAERIERMLPVSGPIAPLKKDSAHVVALIGPTGVGKTTTIAKIAANMRLRENKRVGLVTIDTYRIAAVDQLNKYAEILGAPLKTATSPKELAEAVEEMRHLDCVLIDTAGRSPHDALKLSELKSFLQAANPDEVHLVLSSTASQECIERAIEQFGMARFDKIIFTKLDEAVHMGVVFNVIHKVNKALSYVTTGQDVPDDIEVGHGRRLAKLILGEGRGDQGNLEGNRKVEVGREAL
jgi:flagellar biosynthesis protein FlhF